MRQILRKTTYLQGRYEKYVAKKQKSYSSSFFLKKQNKKVLDSDQVKSHTKFRQKPQFANRGENIKHQKFHQRKKKKRFPSSFRQLQCVQNDKKRSVLHHCLSKTE